MYVTDSKRPVRFKERTKKIARYVLSALPYVLYCHIKFMTRVSARVEKMVYNLMLKLNLLTNYKQ